VLQPQLCSNRHRTKRFGAEFLRHNVSSSGKKNRTAGVLFENDRIVSSNMGRRSNNHFAAHLRHGIQLSERWHLDSGVRTDRHGGYGARGSWSISTAFLPAPGVIIRSAAGKAFRPPSLTELFYSDPAHLSYETLLPETSFSRELGVDFFRNNVDFKTTFYDRRVNSLIDWTRPSPSSPWRIGNRKARFRGINTQMKLRLYDDFALSFSHDFAKVSPDAGVEYKYTGTLPENQLRLGLRWTAGGGNTFDLRVNYEKPRLRNHVTTVDAAFHRALPSGEYYVHFQNLFNQRYEDVSGVPMPGMTATVGVNRPL